MEPNTSKEPSFLRMRVIFTQTLKSCCITAGVRVEWILKAVALQSESLEIGIDFIYAFG